MNFRATSLCLALFAVGCAETAAAPRIDPRLAEHVAVSRAEPGPNCALLGAVEGQSPECDDVESSTAYEAAYDNLRTNAALRGGNFVVIDSTGGPHLVSVSPVVYDGRMSIRGRVFACTSGWPQKVATPDPMPGIDHLWSEMVTPPSSLPNVASVSPAGGCEPECSPGYVCMRNACVMACNPVCFAGQTCGEDRICH
jgi:hypothetical protein